MIKISNRQVIDVVKHSADKAILVEKKPLLDGDNYNVSYFLLNFSTGEKEMVTKDVYLLKKYGSKRKIISEKLGNFVTPSAMILPDRQVLVIYPNGQTGLFDNDGNLKKDGQLSYNDNAVSTLAPDGEYFWTACQNEDAVIRYQADGAKMDLRIGGKDQPTFKRPHFVSADKKYVYVCCDNSYVRKINKKDYSVTDINQTFNDLTGYYKYGSFAIVTTTNGTYCTKD